MTAEHRGKLPPRSSERLEVPSLDELMPSGEVFEALRGTVSEPQTVRSLKPWGLTPPLTEEEKAEGGRFVDGISLAIEGPCKWGLIDWRDNREWSGITNHEYLSTRYTLHLANELLKRQPDAKVNLQTILDGGLLSHDGRRQSDEAGWYPGHAPHADERNPKVVSNEVLGARLIQGKVSEEAFRLVVGLGHGVDLEEFGVDESVYDSLEYKLFIYVDHRVTDRVFSLSDRMGQFFMGNFIPQDQRSPEKLAEIREAFEEIVTFEKRIQGGTSQKKELIDRVDQIAENLGGTAGSDRLSRKKFMELLLNDADTEGMLEDAGIDINLNEETVPMPEWEKNIRRQYVESARDSIVVRMRELNNKWENGYYIDEIPQFGHFYNPTLDEVLSGGGFPVGNWWTNTARELYENAEREEQMAGLIESGAIDG